MFTSLSAVRLLLAKKRCILLSLYLSYSKKTKQKKTSCTQCVYISHGIGNYRNEHYFPRCCIKVRNVSTMTTVIGSKKLKTDKKGTCMLFK